MKVQVTLIERLTYQITKEIELSPIEYARYIRNGKLSDKKETEIQHDLSGEVDNEHWIETENWISDIEKI